MATLPNTGGSPQWSLIGTFSAGQSGDTVMITAYIHSGYNASVSQDSTYVITFNTSNGSSVDVNGFAGDGSWYAIGYNNAIAPGNIKWVANAPGATATSYSLYIYLPYWSLNSQYTVSVDQGASWANIGSTGQSDPGPGSSTVAIPPAGFRLAGSASTSLLDLAVPGLMEWAFEGTSGNDLTLYPTSGAGNLFINYGPSSTGIALLGTGNVGIGTTNPGAALEVNGSVKLTANSGASMTFQDGTVQSTAWNGVLSGGDYAESVNVSGGRDEYEPGDVLVIDPASEGNFLKSSAPYSTAVTGIYSTRPGVVGRRQRTARAHMNEEVPMAMTGIVPTKVSAENGPIKPGDLLVTSSRPGCAMRGTDRAQMLGAVIGKAIGHLDSGVGVIEAVVTLQ